MDKRKILLIDDESDTLLVLEKQLTIAGYNVLTADCGKSGLSMALSQHPDLIVLDVQMPDIDGGEVDHMLKENPATRDIPVVFLTCLLSTSESNKKNHRCGEKIMLAKTSETRELLAVIADILSPKAVKV